MTKKLIFYLSIIILIIINILIDMNINNYIKVLENCFNTNIILTDSYYSLIYFITAFISVLIIIAVKLVVFYKIGRAHV